ncbi:MAG: hypothetical protein A3D31_18065 [Candidatus Fluviicola riflensis]|nr:MAG: hypothetical protein CHH17_03005 [Candidatus Fluviicola riflensis]OGS76887.1 MAG: hypothetical protein A3D31_18065 [Candidatus Fluviicola riflensis]OGS81817.1 MAG: hypothetical protein A2724_15465 [Fluviicola sp. RIFCSPHIGHO2_01_FULL_43_53]OGS88616.1 MAG: hypothetical protein A3E30_07575 [Fluviicola sp. RIFCSPHIGHO2_12_FULL_43_24]
MNKRLIILLIVACQLTVFMSRAQNPVPQTLDSLQTDSIPPPLYPFLSNDSLISYYVVEDTAKYTYGMICSDLDYFLKTYPDLVHDQPMGKSEFGLELRTVRIGKVIPNKRSVFLVGNIHAREDYSSKLLMKFLNVYLLAIDGKSPLYPNAKQLLDSIDIYITPVANPDGLKIAHNDLFGIEHVFAMVKDSIFLEDSYNEWKANGIGIDLNDTFDDGNFELKKGGVVHTKPASEGYKGLYAAQAKETQALQNFVLAKRPLITSSFHTKGNIFFWADAKTHALFKNVDTEIVQKAAAVSGFRVASISKNPADYGCGLENYVRSKVGLIGVCVELSRGDKTRFQHPDNQFNKEVWERAWQLPYLYVENAVIYGSRIEENARLYMGN